jgi:hypothetical protein
MSMMKLKHTAACIGAAMMVLSAALPLRAAAQALTPAEVQRKQEMQALGEKYKTAWDLFAALKTQAGRNAKTSPASVPSWAGVWARGKGGLQYDPDLGPKDLPLTATLTAAGKAVVEKKVQQIKTTGGEYDPISDCRPPGVPRWFTEPFLKEFVTSPDQTWLMNEMVNDVRRIYTDGRAHTPDSDAYPTWNGDSVGFWVDDMLVSHTSQLTSGQYQRGVQPNYSEKVEVVERWRKVDDKNLHVDVWVYDPVNLVQPWYTRQIYTKLTNLDHKLRLRYWDCRENKNNDIIVTNQGTSQFSAFDFVKDNAASSNDPAVKAANQKK